MVPGGHVSPLLKVRIEGIYVRIEGIYFSSFFSSGFRVYPIVDLVQFGTVFKYVYFVHTLSVTPCVR